MAEHRAGVREAMQHDPAEHARADRVRPELEFGDDTCGRGEAESLGCAIELAEQRAALDPGGAPGRVDRDRSHLRAVEHEAAVADRLAGDFVAPAAYRHPQIVLAGEPHRSDDVSDTAARFDRSAACANRRGSAGQRKHCALPWVSRCVSRSSRCPGEDWLRRRSCWAVRTAPPK